MIALKLIFGLALLVAGAEVLVKGASRIAASFGITPLVIGLTVVAFGTSSPELAVSIMSSLEGNSDIALGNVIGSNIFNILFILGVSSIIVPLVVAQQLIRLDVPIMIGASLTVLLFGWDGTIQWWEGLIFLLTGIFYTIFIIIQSKKEKSQKVIAEYRDEFGEVNSPSNNGKTWLPVLFVLAGLAMLVFGSRWLVDGAVAIAKSLGVSDLVVGLTIIAAGTSLPEVATSIIASMRGERDIAVGNVVGSNIFNIFIILGAAALAGKGIAVPPSAITFDIPVMTTVAVACLPIFFTGKKIERWEGFVFLGYYVAYTVYIILASLQSHSLKMFSNAMIWFAIPLTVLTLAVLVIREVKQKR